MTLAFDPGPHVYTWNGQPVPSVSAILDGITDFSMVPPDVLEHKKQIGTAIHLAAEYYDRGVLDEDTVDPRVTGYFAGWKKYRAARPLPIVAMEEPAYHQTLRYAGTPDRIVADGAKIVVVDIKTTATLYPSVGLQLAAYALLWTANNPTRPAMERHSVRLMEDGAYSVEVHRDPDDFQAFLACLSRYRWMKKHGLLKTAA